MRVFYHPSHNLTPIVPLRSGDVGIGLNVRRMRTDFLSAFTVTYSLRPLGEFGSIFRRYPNQWQVLCESHNPLRFCKLQTAPS